MTNTINLAYAIDDEERKANIEFFRGYGKRTPERYFDLKSKIIQLWNEIKPKYVTKSAARITMNLVGDTNSISRIHDYLERSGQINVEENGQKVLRKRRGGRTKSEIQQFDENSSPEPEVNESVSDVDIEAPLLSNNGNIKIKHLRDTLTRRYFLPESILEAQLELKKFKMNCLFDLAASNANLEISEVNTKADVQVVFNTESFFIYQLLLLTRGISKTGILGGHKKDDNIYVMAIECCAAGLTDVGISKEALTSSINNIYNRGLEVIGWLFSDCETDTFTKKVQFHYRLETALRQYNSLFTEILVAAIMPSASQKTCGQLLAIDHAHSNTKKFTTMNLQSKVIFDIDIFRSKDTWTSFSHVIQIINATQQYSKNPTHISSFWTPIFADILQILKSRFNLNPDTAVLTLLRLQSYIDS